MAVKPHYMQPMCISESEKWQQPMHMNLGVPSPRAAHCLCTVDKNLYIFGGRDTEKRQNDLHIFNVGKLKRNIINILALKNQLQLQN